METLTAKKMKEAFRQLDGLIPKRVSLLVGGGGAMLLAYDYPLSTTDVDAIPKGMSMEELKPLIEKIAADLSLAPDWLNPWFGSFTHVLRPDYDGYVVEVFQGRRLRVVALGKEDLLLMKCFAHREKDIRHARALVRAGAKISEVEKRIAQLVKAKVPGTAEAADFLDQIMDMEEG